MANSSDTLLSKLESISWKYSINCQIHGRDNTLLIKYLIEDDFYAVMVTDLIQTYFECLDGKDIDQHFHRFNKGEVKRERLVSHLKNILSDVTKAEEFHFETLVVDSYTSRLTLKVRKPLTILKFEWSFYMISTNPETLSRHLTLPLIRGLSSLKHGFDVLKKEIKTKDKLLEQTMDANNGSKADSGLSDEWLIDQMLDFQTAITSGTDDNSLIIQNLVEDNILSSLLNSDKTLTNNSQINVKQMDKNVNQTQKQQKPELNSQVSPPEARRKSPQRQSKKIKL